MARLPVPYLLSPDALDSDASRAVITISVHKPGTFPYPSRARPPRVPPGEPLGETIYGDVV